MEYYYRAAILGDKASYIMTFGDCTRLKTRSSALGVCNARASAGCSVRNRIILLMAQLGVCSAVVVIALVVACDWRSALSAAGGLFGAEECLWWVGSLRADGCAERVLCAVLCLCWCVLRACYSRLYAR